MKFVEIMKPKKSLTIFSDNEIRMNFIKNYFVKTAKMLSKYPPFASLSQAEKVGFLSASAFEDRVVDPITQSILANILYSGALLPITPTFRE